MARPTNAVREYRQLIKDLVVAQHVLMERIKNPKVEDYALPALVSALTRLIPLIPALRGSPLFLHGTMTKRVDMSPKDVSKVLRETKRIIDIASIEDAEPEPSAPTEKEKSSNKESLSKPEG